MKQLLAHSTIARTLVAGVLVLVGVPAGAQDFDPVEVISRSNDALVGLKYEGTRQVTNVDLVGAKSEVVYREYFDGTKAGLPLRRLEYVRDGHLQGFVMVDDGKFVTQYSSTTKLATRQASGTPMLAEVTGQRTALLLENYNCYNRGMQTVAGRRCYVVEVLPHLTGNPSMKLYVDFYTYLPLKTVNNRGTGTLKSVSEFTRIAFNPKLDPNLFTVPRDVRVIGGIGSDGPHSLQEAGNLLKMGIRTPRYLPQGYVFAGAHCLWGGDNTRGVHLLYFDGLSTISLFEEPTTQQLVRQWIPAGTVHQVYWADGALKYTLIGDIVPTELARIRDSM